ncbi:MAG: hypothetical protein UEA60_10575 [Lachnospiraceae bacterium]|nr:hypothetical protein [Lachnospiraceae bacterium]
MVEYILGNYLVGSGKISSEQLEVVVEQLDKIRVKLGLIAVAEGMMTLAQAEEVNRLQSVMDKRFGDIAIEKGYLTDDQIGNLLKAQGNTYMSFVQSLVNEGFVRMEEIDTIFDGYREGNGFTKSDMETLKSDEPERIVPLFLTPETMKHQDVIGVAVRTIIRCVDRHMYIGKVSVKEDCEIKNAAIQEVKGEGGYTTAFAEQYGGLLKLASIFGQEDFDRMDVDALDAVGEFLNCVNGLHASALSQNGAILELMPPNLITEETKLDGKVCVMPIYVKGMCLAFIVKE